MQIRILLFVIFFIVSCEGEVEGQTDEADRNNYPEAKIFLDLVDDGSGGLSLTVSIGNFEDVDNMAIDVKFDYDKMTVTGFTEGDFTNLQGANSYELGLPDSLTSFIFSAVSGSGILFILKLDANNYEDSAILIDWRTIYMTSNNEAIYSSCSDSDYQNNVACTNSGNNWSVNSEELKIESICYVDAHPSNGDQYGGYGWRRGEFCKSFLSF